MVRATTPQMQLLVAAYDAGERAYAPYSNFQVGAAVLTSSGKTYSGCNVENASYGLTMCAERVAIVKAISEDTGRIASLALACLQADDSKPRGNTPCGACLQVMSEFMDDEATIIIGLHGNPYKICTLADLLPGGFRL